MMCSGVWRVLFMVEYSAQTGRMRSLVHPGAICHHLRIHPACAGDSGQQRLQAVEVINTIEELLKLYPPPMHLRMYNGPEFIANALKEVCTAINSSTA
jgi:putative transposase